MVKTLLVSQIIEDGVKLLHELDRQKFAVETMFWIDVPDHHYWRLVIASRLVIEEGSGAIYRKLGEILRAIGVSGFKLGDVSVLEPESQQFRDYLAVMGASSRIEIGAEWVVFADGIVYRWTGASVEAELSCELGPEQLGQIWEAASKRSNQPRLLFNTEGRQVTIRFHPQHGPQRKIEGIKQAFSIALHNEQAFPDCKVKWLD